MRIFGYLISLTLALLSTSLNAHEQTGEDPMLLAISGLAHSPQGQSVGYFNADPATQGYLATPEGEGPFPAVILIHEWNGLVDRVRQTADAFAEHGYIALAADLYSGRTGSSREENMALVREVRADEATMVANLNAAVSYLREQANSTGKVATIGWCFGGGVALSYALGGDEHDGTAIFYGSLLEDPSQMAHVHHPVYGTFAENDRGIPVAQVEAFVAAMREAGIANDVHIYDNVRHGFWLYTERDPQNNAPAAADAWQRLQAFLKDALGSAE
jgi:carboxymethylenebutenolidase